MASTTLPTLTLTQDQFNLVVAAFPGTTAAEQTQNYLNWLTNRLIDRVQEVQSNKAVTAIAASMPTRPADPPYPT